MPFTPPAHTPRCAVVDLGSNSVRLVVFEGHCRNPIAIFNEKAVLRLGRGLTATGRLNEEAVGQAITVMGRYHAIARAMGANPFEVLATAAVRDARNGPDFVAALSDRMPGVPIRILSGEEEARLSAEGVAGGIPQADGLLADIGGGSLELVRLDGGQVQRARTLRLGVIRLADRAGGEVEAARGIADADLAAVDWLEAATGGDLYLVGGAWRALARIHMAQIAYPLAIVDHYTIDRGAARDLADLIAGAGRRALERLPGVPRRRVEDLPFAAVVLRRLLRAIAPPRVVFSASGLREGWYLRQVPQGVRAEDPLLAAAQDLARMGRDPSLPPALIAWTAPIFRNEPDRARRLREAACWLSDIGSHDHPEYRAEQAMLRVLRQPGIAVGHADRAFLGMTLALRYEAEPDAPCLMPVRHLLDLGDARRAEMLGHALRLAYTLSAGTPDLLAATALAPDGGRLLLRLDEGMGVFAGESVMRRLDRLARAMGLEAGMVPQARAA